MPRLIFVAILAALCGCGRGGTEFAVRGTEEVIRTRLSPHDQRTVVFEPEPAIPPAIERGKTLAVSVVPTYQNGEACRFCKVRWTTDRGDVAAVHEPSPPCNAGRCVILEGVDQGEAVLSLEVCPSEWVDCLRREFTLTVAR